MKVWNHLFGAGLILALASCIPLSLNPTYTQDVLVSDDRLLGVWGDSEESSWTIADNGDGAYRVTAREDEAVFEYEGHLFRLKDDYFLDLRLESAPDYPDSVYDLQLVPAHTFFKVVFTETSWRFDSLDMEWLTDRADRGRLFVPHVRIEELDNLPVFTCSSKRMQRFLRRWAHVEEAWSVGDEAPRLQPTM